MKVILQLGIILWYPLWVHVLSSRLTPLLHCSLCSNCCHHDLQGTFCRALLNFEVPLGLFLQPVSVPLMFPEVINEDAEHFWPHCQPLGSPVVTGSRWLLCHWSQPFDSGSSISFEPNLPVLQFVCGDVLDQRLVKGKWHQHSPHFYQACF